jgi:amino acid adenylation domain-containing protein
MLAISNKLSNKSHNPKELLTEIEEYFEELCVHEMFEAQSERTPDAVAVVLEDKCLTYRELNEQANQLAHYLLNLDVKPDVMVGICVERSLEMVVAILGVLKAGGAYVPIDPNYPLERLTFILDDTQTPILLTQQHLLQKVPATTAQAICVDSEWEIIACHSRENPAPKITIDNLIYVIYTSGSTGQPKGVMVPHRGIVNQLYWRQNTFGLSATDKVLQNISFSFDPSVWQIFWPLCFGGQLVLPRPEGHKDSAYLVKLIAEQQITISAFVPSMLRVLLEEEGIDTCKCLRHISCGGEALPVDLIERFFERLNLEGVLHNVYGPTEASIDATFWKCESSSSYSVAPIGQPIQNAKIYILDENLQSTPTGEVGELHIGGVGLALGYLNRPELTASKFILNPLSTKLEDRLYKTGDLGRVLPDGNIEFLGRIDHQVKIRGFRIELGEIETTLVQLPNIREAVVIAQQDDKSEKHLVAYIVPEQGQTLKTSDIRNYLKQKLAEYMVPAVFVILEALPLNANGKVDRQALPVPGQTREELDIEFIASSSEIETQLIEIWQELLGIESIGVKDHFFDLGGTSLLAVRMLTKIERRFGQKLPVATFLKAATVEELANILQQEDNSQLWSTLVPIQANGEKPPLYCVHGVDGNVVIFQNLVEYLDPEQPVYGLQPQGLDGKQDFLNRIEDIATEYIQHIRNFQPEGPYYLAGFSIGGVIIFEMAQQLLAQGQEVALLALFDTLCPKYLKYLSTGNWLTYHWRTFNTLKPEHKLVYLRSGLKECWYRIAKVFQPKVASSIPHPDEDEDQRLFFALTDAVHNYTPQPLPGKITLFRCVEQKWWVNHDPQLGWAELTEKPVEVTTIPGNHDDSITTNAKFIAQKLRRYLQPFSNN